MLDFCGFHVGKYTSPMDPMGMNQYVGGGFKHFLFSPLLIGEDEHFD